MTGITRKHGGLLAPKNFAGVSLGDFYLSFHGADTAAVTADYNSGSSTPAGALDQIFRTAVETVGTVSRVGTLGGIGGAGTLAFAVEVLGADAASPGYLGMGPTDGSPNPASTAAALTAAVQALSTLTFTDVNGVSRTVHCSSATVTAITY